MKLPLLSCILFLAASAIHSQTGVAINTSGNPPHASAMLDVSSTTRGLLAPRMNTAQRIAIASPAPGLLVFDNETNSFWCYADASWVEILDGPVTILQDEDADTRVQVEETADEDVIRFDLAGTEYFRMDEGRLEIVNTGGSILLGEGAGTNDDQSSNENIFIGHLAGNLTTTGNQNI
ncbi:MAG: hypothetical protein R3330_05775, partial [Saprospiraceae bacterium]|nr:hypothetical protein [Saprospiraceae bacterium]